ncbi:MAG: citrate/2-methylcitrate synthase [Evtepia gabavorous]
MTKRNVEAYAAAQQPLCVQNDTIPESLFQEYGVNRGLRDANGVGVLTGLTNISKIVSFQNVGGKRMPCEGQLWYRGYNIKDLIGGLGPQEFGFEKIAYLLVFGQMPTRRSWRSSPPVWPTAGPAHQLHPGRDHEGPLPGHHELHDPERAHTWPTTTTRSTAAWATPSGNVSG